MDDMRKQMDDFPDQLSEAKFQIVDVFITRQILFFIVRFDGKYVGYKFRMIQISGTDIQIEILFFDGFERVGMQCIIVGF